MDILKDEDSDSDLEADFESTTELLQHLCACVEGLYHHGIHSVLMNVVEEGLKRVRNLVFSELGREEQFMYCDFVLKAGYHHRLPCVGKAEILRIENLLRYGNGVRLSQLQKQEILGRVNLVLGLFATQEYFDESQAEPFELTDRFNMARTIFRQNIHHERIKKLFCIACIQHSAAILSICEQKRTRKNRQGLAEFALSTLNDVKKYESELDVETKCDYHALLGNAYFLLNSSLESVKKAKYEVEKALDLVFSDLPRRTHVTSMCYSTLSKIYERLGRSDLALRFKKLLHRLKCSDTRTPLDDGRWTENRELMERYKKKCRKIKHSDWTKPKKRKKFCSNYGCQNEGVQRCSRCKIEYYCSVRCQKKHWKDDHRSFCRDCTT